MLYFCFLIACFFLKPLVNSADNTEHPSHEITTNPNIENTKEPNLLLNSKPVYLVCWENHLDAIVLLDNTKLYGLKYGWAWELEIINENVIKQKESLKALRMQQLWPDAPEMFDFVFTVPRRNKNADSSSDDPGKTVFVASQHYYAYDNHKEAGNGSMVHWDTTKFTQNLFVLTMHQSNVVLVAKIGLIPDAIRKVSGTAITFDSIKFPEIIGLFELKPNMPVDLEWLKLKQMMPIKGREDNDQQYLALFDMGTTGSYYCIFALKKVQSDQDVSMNCLLVPIASAFQCPEQLLRLRDNNWAQWLWTKLSASLHRIIICLIGSLAGLLWIQIYFMLNTIECLNKFFSSNMQLGKIQ